MHLITKSILKWENKARRLYVKVLENFCNLQIKKKNHQGNQLRILLRKKKWQSCIGCDCFNGLCSVVLFSPIGIKSHFKKT